MRRQVALQRFASGKHLFHCRASADFGVDALTLKAAVSSRKIAEPPVFPLPALSGPSFGNIGAGPGPGPGSEMAVLSSRTLQQQISAVVEALSRAAVAEICALVEQELRRSRRENQDLKKRLRLIQSIVDRGGSDAAGTLVAAAAEAAEVRPDTERGAAAAKAGGAEEVKKR